ncbi:MAG: hypothetical protein JWN76_3396 [Chitinophagaceae bacterium]|nr:hypothetical protein [Chitinophagaceae bacterium]
MSDKTFILNYSYEDLQRYASGQMPAAEMRKLEMQSLKDPFLADALEGVMQADETKAKTDVQFIRENLRPFDTHARRSVAFAWWKIAAAIILIAGLGIISFLVLQPANKTTLAKTEKTIVPPVVNQPGAINNDSAEKKASFAASEKNDQSKSTAQSLNEKRANLKAKEKTSDDINSRKKEVSATLSAPEMADVTASPARRLNVDSLKKMSVSQIPLQDQVAGIEMRSARVGFTDGNIVRGIVTDPSHKGVAGASVLVKGTNIGTTTDQNGSYVLKIRDSVTTASISTIGYESLEKKLHKGFNDTIKLTTSPASLSEVVVTAGYGVARKARVTGTSIAESKSPELEISANLPGIYPRKGWEVMKGNLKEILEEENEFEKSRWDVEIIFSKKGYPLTVKLLKSTSEKLNDLIKEFFENEGHWQNASGKTIRLVVEIK